MRLAALQMRAVPGDRDANLARIERAARDAAGRGASLLIAPELAVTGYGAGDAVRALAEPADGDAVARLRAASLDTGIAILAGFAEAADGSVWNSAVFVSGDAAPVVYRKSHLYGDYEKSLFRPAAPSAVVIDHAGTRLGILICYDVEFPENVRRLAQAGCALVAVPTALPVSDHDAFIAQSMVPVRAFENQIFVAYVNHCGADERFAYAGLSTIAAPDGGILASADREDEELLIAEIDPSAYAASAAQNTYLRDLTL
ncbi:carbon-nitrogen hydrolase family protein [Mesorhizobium microcysteis]|uniref:Carbon-nitrogen hydrolase family protein n=1 Tax=Neoaquamicrobium microcysteis TaxID=2682781 RepID=A0A5D4GNZ9_9HYPH|nr:carbon-nitrogen hydrolase family protein [Mesorhizobium microcysteis]TYR30097.1 carbon-nitrogen hydrolase family protein [Mesorhizobium microcysteis]